MPEPITYRALLEAETGAVSVLIMESFDQHIGSESSPEGVEEFRQYVQPDAIGARIGGDHTVLVAATADGLAGMIEMRQNNHVALLFVGTRFQRRGVARSLIEHALSGAQEARPDVERFTVNSSRYGVSAYERLGFRQTGPERAVNGIAFIPMALQLSVTP
jgi:GNAT superfamily N-acetyltransferase